MTIEETIEDFYVMFPDVSNPEHYPKSFEYYVKLYKYYKSQENNSNDRDN